ncbi:TPA: L-dopachrome tautomerase-related protein [Photobacterium damselae]
MENTFKLKSMITPALLLGSMMSGAIHANDLEVYSELSISTPPGNIAVSKDDRKFISIHSFYGNDLKVGELLKNGKVKAYPNESWAIEDNSFSLNDVLGINIDDNGILWMLDTPSDKSAGRLVGWNTKKEQLERVIYISKPTLSSTSFLNDFAIDQKNNYIYIADSASGSNTAFVVVDLNTGQTKRVLEGSKFTVSEDIDMVIDDRKINLNGQPVRLGIDPITIDPSYQWVYFGAMNGKSLYRINTKYLSNFNLTDKELAKHVERYGDKPISDGITVDSAGNVYVTSITDNSIGIVKPDGSYKTLFKDEMINWPDGFAFGPDNKIYVTIDQLQNSPALSASGKFTPKMKKPFKILRFDSLSPGTIGR